MAHYIVWRRSVLPFYTRHPFYHGEMHRIIRPVGRGRFIFPKGVRPKIGRRGRVIYPEGIRPVPFRKPHIPIRFRPLRHFIKPAESIMPVKHPIPPLFPQRRISPIMPPGVRHPSQPYTTGPIMKHPVGIYRGIGIPLHKAVNRKPPVYHYFPAKPVEHLPMPQRSVIPPRQKFGPLKRPVIAPPNNNIPPAIQRRYGVFVPHRINSHPAASPHGKHKTSHKKKK